VIIARAMRSTPTTMAAPPKTRRSSGCSSIIGVAASGFGCEGLGMRMRRRLGELFEWPAERT
jgi:hypothetical protein